MDLTKKKIFITGADGFIGSHLTEYLVRKGNEVTALAMYNSFGTRGWLDASPQEIRDEMKVVHGDIRDGFAMNQQIRGAEVVFHLAALIAIPYSYSAPYSYVDTNVTGTLNVLQACLSAGVQKVVHTSTSEVYGSAQVVPIAENHPLSAQSPYAATKIAADQLTLAYNRSFKLPAAIIRPFNTYGPRQSARAVIPTIITQILTGNRTIKLGSVLTTRDFNFVQDTVNGFIKVAESDEAVGDVFNVGSGYEVSIKDLVQVIADIMDVALFTEEEESRLRPERSEVDRLCCDNSLAQKRLGWTPRFNGAAGLRAGLQKTIDWFSDKNNLSRYRPNEFNI